MLLWQKGFVIVVMLVLVLLTVLLHREIEKERKDLEDGKYENFKIGFYMTIASTLTAFAGTLLVNTLVPYKVHEFINSTRPASGISKVL